MPQMHFYVPEAVAERLRARAREPSASRFLGTWH